MEVGIQKCDISDSRKAMQRKMESSSESNRKAAHSSSPMVMLNSWTHRPPPPSASRYLDTQSASHPQLQDTWTHRPPPTLKFKIPGHRPPQTFSFKIPGHRDRSPPSASRYLDTHLVIKGAPTVVRLIPFWKPVPSVYSTSDNIFLFACFF